MLFTIRDRAENTSKALRIVKNKKYGIANSIDNSYIIPEKYDNIILYDVNTFALYKNGKIGLCRIDEGEQKFNIVLICNCDYDTIDNFNHDFFLSNYKTIRYYNSLTKQITDFKEIIMDTPYIYGYDELYIYIISQKTGEAIYKRKYNKYDKSYYLYCGNTDKGAVFYDTTFSTYLYPTANGYSHYEYPLNGFIVINNDNIMNIVDGIGGIGIIDSFGNTIADNKYDAISLELKIRAVSENERIEKTIPLPNCTYSKDKVSYIEE